MLIILIESCEQPISTNSLNHFVVWSLEMEVKKKSKATFFFFLAGTRFLNIATERERKIEEASSSFLWIQFLRRQRCEYFYLELVKYYLMKREQKNLRIASDTPRGAQSRAIRARSPSLPPSPLPKGIKGKHDRPSA